MSNEEEQEMEAEALLAIFDSAFQDTTSSSSSDNKQWEVTLYPIDCDDDDESDSINHVGVKLCVDVPMEYPEVLPNLDAENIKVSSFVVCVTDYWIMSVEHIIIVYIYLYFDSWV